MVENLHNCLRCTRRETCLVAVECFCDIQRAYAGNIFFGADYIFNFIHIKLSRERPEKQYPMNRFVVVNCFKLFYKSLLADFSVKFQNFRLNAAGFHPAQSSSFIGKVVASCANAHDFKFRYDAFFFKRRNFFLKFRRYGVCNRLTFYNHSNTSKNNKHVSAGNRQSVSRRSHHLQKMYLIIRINR